ncbi:hypothetical protein H4R99_001230 [Coemansia sp. RSA 1722]|nr:hypothetical protein LPJ57_000578 [Coemansia sp. RSA 486]KAJ2237020.1 hypothetical protein IWW45_001304 [Coemansia sp. RSA 485]KAJ2603537.1 hypothetical protein GGF39_000030 [Coemansia sp. RSA 1721]KAJ2605313.1 hypothetical protein H4R99_001230 [Coemansia sp. RSA 1722]KAJ2638687.1 hypothetical protein GGF40_001463 [Coemansia sp. RSA 1286]
MGKISTIESDAEDNVPLINSLKELGNTAAETSSEQVELPKLEHPNVSRIVRAGPSLGPDGKPHYLIDDIPDNEKLRLIRESGLLKKYAKNKTNGSGSDIDEDDEAMDYINENGDLLGDEEKIPAWMDALIYTIGLVAIYGLFEALVNQQYNVEITMLEVVERMAKALPAIYFIVFVSHKYRSMRVVSLLMLAASCASGCYFVHLNLHSPRLGIMRRAPGLVTMWIYLTFMMDVRPSIISAAVVCLFWVIDPFKLSL